MYTVQSVMSGMELMTYEMLCVSFQYGILEKKGWDLMIYEVLGCLISFLAYINFIKKSALRYGLSFSSTAYMGFSFVCLFVCFWKFASTNCLFHDLVTLALAYTIE